MVKSKFPEELPLFDIEYLFLNIRAKSGEVVKFQVICPDDKITLVPVDIDLTEVNVPVDDKHNNNILLDESRNLESLCVILRLN